MGLAIRSRPSQKHPGIPRGARTALSTLLRTARVPAGPIGPRAAASRSGPDVPAGRRPA